MITKIIVASLIHLLLLHSNILENVRLNQPICLLEDRHHRPDHSLGDNQHTLQVTILVNGQQDRAPEFLLWLIFTFNWNVEFLDLLEIYWQLASPFKIQYHFLDSSSHFFVLELTNKCVVYLVVVLASIKKLTKSDLCENLLVFLGR